MQSTKLNNLLIEAGLDDKEADVYLAALELGKTTILEIAKHSKVKRSTVYEIIPALENKGLIKRAKVGKKYFYLAESPKTVVTLIKEREKRFAEALPQLMSLFNSQEERPKVYFYQGPEEIKQMYEDTIREGKDILNYTSIINLYQYLDKEWVDDYIKRRIDAGIKTRIIALVSRESEEWHDKAKTELREIRLVPKDDYNFSADVHIYGNKVIITTYKSGLFGLLIEDVNIAQMQKMAFELMWLGAEKVL
ncbi:MAG: transcriptional regulator TrmB [Berkelbacteria bacterium GW2011_GWE1_39_12]|uniref:Transcriptional regulator TrmB n=1 Tax=Berkelbacteria bacterium GW2011_GWE1_39_12 TaxID=1618337 RepID=A0A0G4B2U5_9BACT|nr:MAG: transcriptional regulator TrmB [Berkelbacteria bacterium GW2011_GWE1_39_12]